MFSSRTTAFRCFSRCCRRRCSRCLSLCRSRSTIPASSSAFHFSRHSRQTWGQRVKRKKSSGAIGVRQIFRVSQDGTESFKEFVIFVIVDGSSSRVFEGEVTLHEAHDRFTVAPSL